MNSNGNDFNPYGEPQRIEEGDNYVLVQGLHCFQVFNKDGQQVFGTYDQSEAKKRFVKLELQAREGS
jgi:hypothetical protein